MTKKEHKIAADVQLVDIKKLIPYTLNNRNHPESQLIALKNSLIEFGFTQPIVCDKDFVIIAGHGRYTAALSLEYTTVPCIVRDDLSDAQTRRLRLLDNKIAEMSEKNIGNIKEEIDLLAIEGLADDLGIYFADDLAGVEIDENVDETLEERDEPEDGRMAFLVTKSQRKVIEEAIAKEVENTKAEKMPEDNKNGVALYSICKKYLEGYQAKNI